MEPLVFEPYLRPMVWGGRKLGDRLGKILPHEGTFGESWEISPHPHHVSRVAGGPHGGSSLLELCQSHHGDLFGKASNHGHRFPLLIKLLDCRDLLSIQTHPSDDLAQQLANETFGKTEAWIILEAEEGATIYAGFQPGITRAEVEKRLADETLEEILHAFTPRPGDCLFLPAGTVHAVGGGVLMAEVQQASDATFRLYDWKRPGPDGKPRTLHVEQALQAINWEQAGPVHPIRPERTTRSANSHREQHLVRCPYFSLDRIVLQEAYQQSAPGRLSIWMVLHGSAGLQAASYQKNFVEGQTVLIPASSPDFTWKPWPGSDASLLRITLPDLP